MHLLKTGLHLVVTVVLLAAFTFAYADPRIDRVWVCTLKEGKTLEDLNKAHRAWVTWANEQSFGGDVRGYVAGSIVSSDINTVLIIDSYPDMETLTADWNLYYGSDEGEALEANYEAVSTCTSNSLFMVMDSGDD